MKMVTLNEIHRYIQNFMLYNYKMIYFSSHKFAFLIFRFSPFYEHFLTKEDTDNCYQDLILVLEEDRKEFKIQTKTDLTKIV